jgi:TolB-like protein/Tfp pilus assembly protein PilF
MKRCPTCDRLEADDALTFCRVDGTPLVRESGTVSEAAGTLKPGSATAAGDTETRILPQPGTGAATDEALSRNTAPTTVLDARRASSGMRELRRTKSRKVIVIAAAAIITVAVAAAAYRHLSRGKNAAGKSSVAVLPFVNASGDQNMEYLSDGITESLINSLSQLPNLAVKARSTVFRYKGKEADPQKVGAELNVQAVLSGRVAQRGDDLTLSLEMVDAKTGDQMWGSQYNRKLTDLMSLQGEIARDVTSQLRVKLSGGDEQRLAKSYTGNNEAYQLYLKGRFYWNKRTQEAYDQAIDYFRQAIEKDPNYALAYSGLADCYILRFGNQSEGMPKAKEAATHALALDPMLAEAHTSLAFARTLYDRDWAGARAEFEEAIRLNPKYATAHQWFGIYWIVLGKPDEALAENKRALELDPLSLIINTDRGRILYYARRNDEAIKQLQETLKLDADFGAAHYLLGWCHAEKGMYDEAVAEIRKARDLGFRGDGGLGRIAHAYARAGKRTAAQKILEELQQRSKETYVSPYTLAVVYGALGEKELALSMLQKAVDERGVGNSFIKVDPAFDPLRSDPRFAELLQRAGFPQ